MAAIYEIVVESELGASCAAAFEGMRVEHVEGKTVLVGPIEDQAQLAGMLNRISGLGLSLVSVEKLAVDLTGERD